MPKKTAFFLLITAAALFLAVHPPLSAQDVALKGGTVMTITRGTIENGTVLIRNGKIAAVGRNVPIPAGVRTIDVTGKYVLPGLIDTHTHIAMDGGDINEATDPITPQLWMKDILLPDDPSILTTLSGGVTTVKAMHGSANVIGAVNATIKLKYGRPLDELLITDARPQLKMALGENPKRLYGGQNRMPSTRLGTVYLARKAFTDAREYKAKWDEYEQAVASGKKDAAAPARDDKLETLKLVLEHKMTIDIHIYRADEMVWFLNFCREFGLECAQISHCVDGYKVADLLAERGVTYGGWTDWWGFKEEAYDGCPYGFDILDEAGVNIVINSDSADETRYLYLNAAKVQKYNDLSDETVLRMITINAAKTLEMDKRAGSLEPGKDGDIAVFDKYPLDSTAKCLLTLIEGELFFDLARDGQAGLKGGAR
ncbi:MAG: amidohydrolase family protein [Candidatus Aminicenantes bacterium]|nr:amidohydrolase family protein [Candidatus Aminicenantes bacterium]